MYNCTHEICTIVHMRYVQLYTRYMYTIVHMIYVQLYTWDMFNCTHEICAILHMRYVQFYTWDMYNCTHNICTILQIFPPVVWGLEFSQHFPCACRKSRLIKGYELSYATGSLNAGFSCIRWGVGVWTVGHWVVPVQVIYCSIDGWILFFKRTNGIPERSFWVAAIVVSMIFQ